MCIPEVCQKLCIIDGKLQQGGAEYNIREAMMYRPEWLELSTAELRAKEADFYIKALEKDVKKHYNTARPC